MGDHSQVFHLVEVFLDLWVQGNGEFPGGMYHRMNIMLELDLVFARESTNAHEVIWELLYQVLSGPVDLAAAGTAAGLIFVAVVEAGAGLGGFVLGCMTVTTQFILMIASLMHDGRPRMAGPGVSSTYQCELILRG